MNYSLGGVFELIHEAWKFNPIKLELDLDKFRWYIYKKTGLKSPKLIIPPSHQLTYKQGNI